MPLHDAINSGRKKLNYLSILELPNTFAPKKDQKKLSSNIFLLSRTPANSGENIDSPIFNDSSLDLDEQKITDSAVGTLTVPKEFTMFSESDFNFLLALLIVGSILLCLICIFFLISIFLYKK